MANLFIVKPDGSKTLVTKEQLVTFAQGGWINPDSQIEVLGRIVSASKIVELRPYFDAKKQEKSEQAPPQEEPDPISSTAPETVEDEFSEQTSKEDSPSYVSPLESEKPQKNPDMSGVIPQLAPLPTNASSQNAKSEISPKSSEEESSSTETFDFHGKAFEKKVDMLIDQRIPVSNVIFGLLVLALIIAGLFALMICLDEPAIGISAVISVVIVLLTSFCLREMILTHLKSQIRQELFLTEILKELKSKSNN